MFRSALRRARTALQPLVTGARASAPHVERRALSTLCASDLAAAGRVSPVAAVHIALRRDIHASSLLHDAASTDSSEKGLYQVLGEELEHERTTYVPSEVVSKGPPEPFEIIETDGDCEITLVRAYGDDEEIAVTFNATEDPYEEDEYFNDGTVDGLVSNETDEDDEDVTIHFTVSVSRGDGHEGLEFSCATDGETVEVRNVRYESLGSLGSSDDEDDEDAYFSSYPGPNYDELDESVQEEFHKYLEARGIDATLANYIAEVHVDKEQREYTRWLENVANFVK